MYYQQQRSRLLEAGRLITIVHLLKLGRGNVPDRLQ